MHCGHATPWTSCPHDDHVDMPWTEAAGHNLAMTCAWIRQAACRQDCYKILSWTYVKGCPLHSLQYAIFLKSGRQQMAGRNGLA
jgi:hypothetical protein